MRLTWKYIMLWAGSVTCLCGCATATEAGKKIWGSSIEHLERQRPQGVGETFALSLPAALEKTEAILTNAGATVYLKSKNKATLAAMNFQGYVDTTQVGVFFTSLAPGQTQVEVASMIPRLTKEVGELIFKGLKETK